uniref:Tetratricopeptide repeat, ankyrin repeat and coiled-coil containing 2 n=1 Tax=Rousettus aegyptiacus TaxID=9407 RepID=A0A7J8GGK7_ROUAE|nr:tetratricopeptide repeat, ankyrin repeat and coiled-coil containing 2 [Rousettus aegyptiacus]
MFRNSLKMLLTGGKSSRKNRSSDGGSEEPPDRRQSSVDSRQSCSGQGGISTESDCAFEPDYAVPPLPVSEAPLRKAKFVESPRIPESELGSPTLTSAQKLDVDAYCPGKHACEVSASKEGGLEQAHLAEQYFACILFIKTCLLPLS